MSPRLGDQPFDLTKGRYYDYTLFGPQHNRGNIEDARSFRITSFQGEPKVRGQQVHQSDTDGEKPWSAVGFYPLLHRDGQGAGA